MVPILTNKDVFESSCRASALKSPPAMKESRRGKFNPWVGRSPGGRQPTPVFLPGECHGQRSLAGYRPKDCKDLDTAKVHWKDWCWSWNSNTLAISCKELTHWKRPWCWEGLGAGGEGDDRGWGGWMASLTWWTCAWVNSRSWWWTGRPGMLWFMGLLRVRHDWETEQSWTESNLACMYTWA